MQKDAGLRKLRFEYGAVRSLTKIEPGAARAKSGENAQTAQPAAIEDSRWPPSRSQRLKFLQTFDYALNLTDVDECACNTLYNFSRK
jgi:hypothetical protein